MNGIHDMGGMHGFGPIDLEEHEPLFPASWDWRLIFAIRRSLGTLGWGRVDIENLDPAVYLTSSYYERSLQAAENALIERGLVTSDELDAKTELFRQDPEARVPRREDLEQMERTLKRMFAWQPLHREVGIVPRFKVGDAVKTRNINPPGHTRLPRYVRGKRGVIAMYHGVHGFRDGVLQGSEGEPQAVYNVRFGASELWGDVAEVNQSLYIDLWESYLEPA